MFETLAEYPVDPIMIGADLFARDPREDKLNLTVGIYQDAEGRTPVLRAVKAAEQRLVDGQETKSYLALTGDAAYCEELGQAILGPQWGPEWVAAQTAGGAVALRVMADLLAALPGKPTVWLQTTTYGNYLPILTAAGARHAQVPYYDTRAACLTFDAMMSALQAMQPGDVFLMQGPCHNPTGADLSPAQFDQLLDLLEARGVIPWIDLAYLGFDRGFDADCTTPRAIAARFEECILCVTLSKSFGLYRDRAGALMVKTRSGDRARMDRAITAIVRAGPSHAPDHGPSVVRLILQDPALTALWQQELEEMRQRVAALRAAIVQSAEQGHGTDTLSYLGTQRGMFSLLPLSPAQELGLTQQHGIHVVQGGRINVARLRDSDIPWLIRAVLDVTAAPR